MEEQKTVGEWDSYISNFLKHTDVTSEDLPFVAISAEEVENRDLYDRIIDEEEPENTVNIDYISICDLFGVNHFTTTGDLLKMLNSVLSNDVNNPHRKPKL